MDTTDENAFLQAIAERPHDVRLRLVYADWLEENGDPRADEIRANCQFRVPITPKETRHLIAIAAGRRQADASQVTITVTSNTPGYQLVDGPSSIDALVEDLENISPLAVALNFPREDKGRLELGTVVLLARYPCKEALPIGRALWLTAKGPLRRGDPQVITIELDQLIGENQVHNWSHHRWWWDYRHEGFDDFARWGVTATALREITGPKRARRIAELETRRSAGTLTEAERIAICTAYQDDGRFEDALRLCDVEFEDELSRMLDLEMPRRQYGISDDEAHDTMTARARKLRRALWEMAPWRLGHALLSEQVRLDEWRSAKVGRARKRPLSRLFCFPRSGGHQRKPGLMLVAGARSRPRLVILSTAANVVLPAIYWQRPVELDIARWGVEDG